MRSNRICAAVSISYGFRILRKLHLKKNSLQAYLLARQKEQDVAWGLRQVDLHHGNERSIEVVTLGVFGVQDLDRERATGNGEDGAVEKVF